MKKIISVPDGVDLERFESLPDRLESREKLGFKPDERLGLKPDEQLGLKPDERMGLKPDERIVLYTGQMIPEKGINTILDCAAMLPGVSFLLLGGFEELIAPFRQRARKMALDNVRFTGFVANEKIPNFLRAADVLLLPNSAKYPSAQWTSPLKMFEYMASGTPMIASRIPAVDGILHDGNALFMVPDDPASMKEAILKALDGRAWAAGIAGQAKKDVQGYTWERRVERILQCIERNVR